MSKLTCDIVHLGDRVYRSEDVEMVVVPGQLGETGIMENHVPIVAKLKSGAVRVHLNDGTVKTIASKKHLWSMICIKRLHISEHVH